MKLNARLLPAASTVSPAVQSPSIVLLHGLFGSMDNLGTLARDLSLDYQVLQVDMRNHGLSPHSDEMSYACMAQDVLDTLNAYDLPGVMIIGHSMGGKAAMAFSMLAPERLAGLIIIDIAPVNYQTRHPDALFNAIQAVSRAGVNSRNQAAQIMEQFIADRDIMMFLLKSFQAGEWRFNVPVLQAQYSKITGWQTLPAWLHPVLFIRGEQSDYLEAGYQPALLAQFPRAQVCSVPDSGHWVHAQKPMKVIALIRDYLRQQIA